MKEQLSDWLSEAERILIFTGAGISTPSGIPAFRGRGGIWATRKPVEYSDFMTRKEARIEYWEYKLEMWEKHGGARPNVIHESIVQLEQAGKVAMVVTQNIDGLHRAAGTGEEVLVEIHGTGSLAECQTCGQRNPVEASFIQFKQSNQPPICECGGFLKPATISFGQNLREDDLDRAYAAVLQCDLVIALGSTLTVSPANLIPLAAAQAATPYIIINRDETDHDGRKEVTLRIQGEVEEVFPAAVESALAK